MKPLPILVLLLLAAHGHSATLMQEARIEGLETQTCPETPSPSPTPTLPVWGPAVLHDLAGWFRGQGQPWKDEAYLRPFLESAWRVSGHIQGYPGKDRDDNALKLVCQGAAERMFAHSFVQVNIPGTHLKNGLKIRFFTLDYGWVGDNHTTLPWAEATALWLQQGGPEPRLTHESTKNSTARAMVRCIHIPADIKLKQVDVGEEHWVRKRFDRWVARGHSGHFKVESGYREVTADDLDSMLYYRSIEEFDRRARGWKWGYWYQGLYERLHPLVISAIGKHHKR